MKRFYRIMILAAVSAVLSAVPVMAAGWAQDGRGWWWDIGNGQYPVNRWAWCDGDYDGTAECYYFDQNGYCLMNTTTPDGYRVNGSGAWVQNGQVVTEYVGVQTPESWMDGPLGGSGGGSSYVSEPAGQTTGRQGSGTFYNLAGWQSLDTEQEGVSYGHLVLNPDGTGEIQIESDSPVYQLTWSRSGDTISLNYGFSGFTGYCYDELGQIRLVIGDCLYYFQQG